MLSCHFHNRKLDDDVIWPAPPLQVHDDKSSIFISQVCSHCFSFFSFYPKRSICFPNSNEQRKTKDITIRKSTQKFTSLRPSPCTVCILPSRRLDEEVMAAGTYNSSWFISSVLSRTSALLLAEFVLLLFSTKHRCTEEILLLLRQPIYIPVRKGSYILNGIRESRPYLHRSLRPMRPLDGHCVGQDYM